MRTLLWSYPGQRQFPKEMSRFEIQHFFTFTDDDRRELRIRFPKRVRLGAALQLCRLEPLRMVGYPIPRKADLACSDSWEPSLKSFEQLTVERSASDLQK
jgi:hypothetical protein